MRRLHFYNNSIFRVLLLISLILSLVPSSRANASSSYDNFIQTTSTLTLKSDDDSCPAGDSRDITNSWNSLARDTLIAKGGVYATTWLDAFDNKVDWVVYQHNKVSGSSAGAKWIDVWWNENDNGAFTEFVTIVGDPYLATWSSGDKLSTPFYHMSLKSSAQVFNYGCDDGSAPPWTDNYAHDNSGHVTSDNFLNNENHIRKLFASTPPVTYPSGYEGISIPGIQDSDGDGLSFARESAQGTSDIDIDYDDDGIDDFKESRWYADRDDVFCGSSECTYPNPTKKDLYVELDWMYKDFRDYKPTPTQLSKVVDAYENQDILAHFDTGQFGGGERLPTFSGSLIFRPTEGQFDFYDMKSGVNSIPPQFSEDRYRIWHYMITGYNFMAMSNEAGSTGAAYPGDDDSIISLEKVEELADTLQYNSSELDTAVAGTILHELGHNLCLSDSEDYDNQAAECVYDEIDKPLNQNPSEDYVSVMNYRFQLSENDYSHGSNGTPDDHNDWAGIMIGMKDFKQSEFEWDSTYTEPAFRGAEMNNPADKVKY